MVARQRYPGVGALRRAGRYFASADHARDRTQNAVEHLRIERSRRRRVSAAERRCRRRRCGRKIHRRDAFAACAAAAGGCARQHRAAQSARHHRRAPELAPPLSGRCRDAARRSGGTAAGWLARGARRALSPPRTTLRLQLHRGFTFAEAGAFASYFAALGVSHIYTSPITTARRGSMHGYDVTDPTRINPELGGEDAFRNFVRELRRHQLGLLVDIVPNHMAVGSENVWWMDVLARGRCSAYARYFDIDWEPPDRSLAGKVLLPVLGRPYGDALAGGEITLG